MSKIYHLERVQKMPISLEKAWDFFSNPNNLLTITPPFLNLKITNQVHGDEIYAGQMITYIVKPLLGIPLFWLTEIRHVEKLRMFVDEQRKGPYKLWHHQHHFKAIEDGVEMTDIVHYAIPFGPLGSIAHALTVRNQLNEIFDYRYKKVQELFGAWRGGNK